MSNDALSASRFERLQALLRQDPGNERLLAECAEAALDEGRLDDAQAALDRYAGAAEPSPQMRNLAALIAMQREDWAAAADAYGSMMAEGVDAPPIRFGLAWALAMQRRFAEALPLIDEATAAALPQAAALLVQLLHDAGNMDEAAEQAHRLIALHPDHRALNAAVATLAIDIEDVELARLCASRAGDHPDALNTLGTLALGEDDGETAYRLFDGAVARDRASPRGWVGRGLARLHGDPAAAATDIDRGAALFGDHLGSWIAAGWAHFIAGDAAAARDRFEKARAIDDNFAEAHGSLAVLDVLAGDLEIARRRTETALRLDRQCFSAALAATLIAAGGGDHAKAQRIFDMAINTPVDGGGRTIAQSLARMGLRSG
ncbi:tetratricopeptide repeat protein [Sphingomonas gilva]|nr:tetratricopeptide repeat protein [Sphingomonas gilva]